MDAKELEFQAVLVQKLKTLLTKTGKKQKELAEKMGVTNSFVAGILNEREKASAYRLNQMLVNMEKPSLLDWIDSLIADEPEKKNTEIAIDISGVSQGTVDIAARSRQNREEK